MRIPRARRALRPLSILAIGCTLGGPAHAQDPLDAQGSPPVARSIGIGPPDLPAAPSLLPSDLVTAGSVRGASDAADPATVLRAYAPVRADAARTGETAPSKPGIAALAPAAPRPVGPLAGVPLTPASSGVAAQAGEAQPVTVRPTAAPYPPESAKVAEPVWPVIDPTPAPPSQGAGQLAGATLRDALDVYVGSEPQPISGRKPGLDMARYKERQAIREAYAAHGYAAIWVENGAFNARATGALRRIERAAEDGLDPHLAPVPVPAADDLPGQARAELALTEAVIAYGRQATGARLDPARIDPLIAAKPDVADAARVLDALRASEDADQALRAFNPPQKGYALLRAKLAELRQASDVAAHPRIGYGPMLKLGMRDPRVPLIRARFGLDMPATGESGDGLVYDIEVAAAVADFQKANHLPASGVLTIRTVAALSGRNPKQIEDEIVANMERWRWLPRDMGENRIEVNIPEYTARVMHADEVFHQTRVVVGQPEKQTPIFSQTMQFIIVNPYWNVPLSIVKKEMLPKLAADPNYFANHGYETVERDGQTYVRQPPGDSNALGRIKFMFPNKYAVYLHDTNARSLFGGERRALSHGCVRVDQPFKFAEAVLGRENGWTEARVKKLVGGNERTINLPKPLPIHIVYFTALVDESGSLRLLDDVYGYSAKVRSALGLTDLNRVGQVAVN